MHARLHAASDNIKHALRPDDDTTDPRAGVFALWNYGFHEVTGLHAKVTLLVCPMLHGKAVFVRSAHLPRAMTHRANE